MFLSDLLGGALVDDGGRRVGRLHDLVVRVSGADPPPVVGALTRRGSTHLFLPADRIVRLEQGATLVSTGPLLAPFSRRPHEVLLGRDVMDSQVIDLHGARVVRVNDVLVEGADRSWHVSGVDVGARALLRRLLPRALRHRHRASHTLRWSNLELLAIEVPGGQVQPDHGRLARLHPADIARVADAMPSRQASEIVASLDDDLAADALEEMIDEKQADVIEILDPDRAADILARMAPDAAADVLAELEPEVVDDVLRLMEPEEAADIHALLTYPKDTAGGLMTTDYVMAPRSLKVGEALAYLRPQMEKPEWVYYVYVVEDTRERRLAGVFSLRDLILAAPTQLVDDIMAPVPRRVEPETPAASVARIMSEYNLMTLPVTDNTGRLLGIVSVDDALETILPDSLRRRVPRVFS